VHLWSTRKRANRTRDRNAGLCQGEAVWRGTQRKTRTETYRPESGLRRQVGKTEIDTGKLSTRYRECG
jgi:hypothetical protein